MKNQNQKLLENIKKLEEKEKIKINHDLQKIVIAVSKPFDIGVTKTDASTGYNYQDIDQTTGKMIFIANKKKYDQWQMWMKENDQWDEVDEIYIYDRFHKSGEDMIERCSMMLHEFSHTITLKEKFKHCWWNEEVSGCKLFEEHALDPYNKAWE